MDFRFNNHATVSTRQFAFGLSSVKIRKSNHFHLSEAVLFLRPGNQSQQLRLMHGAPHDRGSFDLDLSVPLPHQQSLVITLLRNPDLYTPQLRFEAALQPDRKSVV